MRNKIVQPSNVSMPSFIILSVLKGACMGLRGLKKSTIAIATQSAYYHTCPSKEAHMHLQGSADHDTR